jgi:hypothetical protein
MADRYRIHILRVADETWEIADAGDDLESARAQVGRIADDLLDKDDGLEAHPSVPTFMARPGARQIGISREDPLAPEIVIRLLDTTLHHCPTCTCAMLAR